MRERDLDWGLITIEELDNFADSLPRHDHTRHSLRADRAFGLHLREAVAIRRDRAKFHPAVAFEECR